MTRRHLSLFTPTYMYVVAAPGGSGNFLLLLQRPGGICTLSPHTRGLSAGAPISLPTTQTILVTSRQQPFHHETDLRSGSGHQVPQKGGKLPTAAARRPDSCLCDHEEGNSRTSQWNVSRGHEDVQDPCNSPWSSALQQQTATFFQISVPRKPLHPLKKGPGMHQIL